MIIFYSKRERGGYGDRLIGIGACLAISLILKHEFRIIWDEDLSSVFEDYKSAKPLPHYDFRYNLIDQNGIESQWLQTFDFSQWSNRVIMIECNQPVHHNLWLNPSLKIAQSYAEITTDAYSLIYSKYLIIKESLKLKMFSVRGVRGVQIRCGDYYLTGDPNNNYINPTQLENLIKAIKLQIPSDSVVFITSDNIDTYESFKKAFKNAIYYRFTNIEHFDHAKTTESLVNVILDHYTLSKCSSIITRHRSSNFGVTAALTGRVNKVFIYEKWGDNYIIKSADHQLNPFVKTTIPLAYF